MKNNDTNGNQLGFRWCHIAEPYSCQRIPSPQSLRIRHRKGLNGCANWTAFNNPLGRIDEAHLTHAFTSSSSSSYPVDCNWFTSSSASSLIDWLLASFSKWLYIYARHTPMSLTKRKWTAPSTNKSLPAHRTSTSALRVQSRQLQSEVKLSIHTCLCSASLRKIPEIITSTPHQTNKPRVNFHSIESLAISSLNTSSLTPASSPFSLQRHGKLRFTFPSILSEEHDYHSFSEYNWTFSDTLHSFRNDHTSSAFHLDDTGYSSFNSSALLIDHSNKENAHQSPTVTNERKVRG